MQNKIKTKRVGDLLERLYLNEDDLSNREVMELALSYVLPRNDNKDLAEKLLDRFGSFSDVLTTDWFLLKEVEGMSERSAKALSLLFSVFEYYVESGLDKKYDFNFTENICDFFEELLRFKQIENTYIIGLDSKKKVKFKHKLATGGMKSVGVSTHDIARIITTQKPHSCFLCHNHPNGCAKPSENDCKGNEILKSLCKKLHVDLVDHIIVGVDGVFSLEGNKFLRRFNVN